MTPFRTLIWMQWQRTRGVLIGVLPAMLVACFALVLAQKLGLRPGQAEIAAYSALLVSVSVTLITLLLIHSDTERLHVSLPLRTLRLPVRSWKLALAFMAYGFVATALVTAAAALMVREIAGLEFPWWLPPSVAVCLLGTLQAWSYAMRDPSPRLVILGFLLVLAPVIWFLRQDATFIFLTEVNPIVILVGVPLALYVVGALLLGLNRRGGIPAFLPSRLAKGSTEVIDTKSVKPFASPLKTQLWYEWRQFGWQLPALIVTILALYFLLMPLIIGVFGTTGVNHDWSGDKPPTSIYVDFLANAQFVTNGLGIASVVAGVLVGAWMFLRAGYWNTKSTYLMTLPISTRKLSRARLSMAFRSTLIGLAILGGIMGAFNLAMMAHGENNRFIHYLEQGYLGTPNWQVIVFYLGVLFVTMWVAVWPVNAGLSALVYGLTLAAPLGVLIVLRSAGAVDADTTSDELLRICYRVSAGVLVAGLLFFVCATLWKRLAGPLAVIVAAAGAALYVKVFFMFVDAYSPYELANVLGDRFPHPINWPMWIGLAVLPIAPIFVHPYFLDRARHR